MRVVLAEEDTLFRLMEVALKRTLTPGGERALSYFFGPDFSEALAALTGIADRVGLPRDIEVTLCDAGRGLREAVRGADFLVVERVSVGRAEIEAGAGSLRLIQKFGRDCGNIDLDAARDLGVDVARLIRYSTLSSADNILTLLLVLARNLAPAHRAVLAQRDPALPARFETGPPRTKFNWADIRNIRVLADHTLGLVGLGENSGEVARRVRACGMRVVYHKRRPLTPELERELGGVRYLPLDEVLAEADFVSLHVPYGPETDSMVDSAFLGKLRPGACLINTSRGGVVDERALYEALRSGRLAAAALDVYRYEPVPPDCPLLELPNVVWSPHMSGGRPEFMVRESDDVLTNLARAWRGERPAERVVGRD